MRILVLSNFYPPFYIGGYELGCRDAVEALKARGHEVKVLTSFYGLDQPECDGEVYRWLETDITWKSRQSLGYVNFFFKLLRKEIKNRQAFTRLCFSYKPDIIYVWKLTHTSLSIVFTAQRNNYPTCFFIFDHWLSTWETDDKWYSFGDVILKRFNGRLYKEPLTLLLKIIGLLPKKPLILSNIQFGSEYLKNSVLNSGKILPKAQVTHWGVNIRKFPYNTSIHHPVRLLFVGQISPYKGVHTAIEAMNLLVKENGYSTIILTIVGGSTYPDYNEHVHNLVKMHGLELNVHFMGFVPIERLPQIYKEHDIFLFTSIWDEPFGITLLEAMSCGLAVIGTATGGSSEIIKSEETGLTFPKGDEKACVFQILRLLNDPIFFEKIRSGGRAAVEQKFQLECTMDIIEKHLLKISFKEK